MPPALLVQTCRYAATNFGPAKAGLPAAYPARQPRDLRLQFGYSIVKERWFLLPGQPQQCNNKAYCNNIIMYLSRRIHPEIPGGDTGLIGIKAQMYSQPQRRSRVIRQRALYCAILLSAYRLTF
jgi:hypothetical protein